MAKEEHTLDIGLYFTNELALMLERVGFEVDAVQAGTKSGRRRRTTTSSCSSRGNRCR